MNQEGSTQHDHPVCLQKCSQSTLYFLGGRHPLPVALREPSGKMKEKIQAIDAGFSVFVLVVVK